jgi:hypothetical protein
MSTTDHNATLSLAHRTRIDAYLRADKRGSHVTRADEDATHYVLDRHAGHVAITWDSHEARCRALGIQYGSDGPYLSAPGERRRAYTPAEQYHARKAVLLADRDMYEARGDVVRAAQCERTIDELTVAS